MSTSPLLTLLFALFFIYCNAHWYGIQAKTIDLSPYMPCTAVYDPTTLFKEGETCILSIADLRPTQFAIGELSMVCKKKSDYESCDHRSDLEKLLLKEKNFIPVVYYEGTQGFYMTDHHHASRAYHDADFDFSYDGKRSERILVVKILRSMSVKSYPTQPDFWNQMKAHNFTWLYDEHGKGPLNPLYLPQSVKDLKNDPYRTLSAVVRTYGGYGKTTTYFSEFLWANFFRQSISYPTSALTSETAEAEYLKTIFSKAMSLSQSDDAKNLPGYKQGEVKNPDCKLLDMKTKSRKLNKK